MSKKYPEYLLYNYDNFKELHNPKFCAIVREDKTCLKKRSGSKLKKMGNQNSLNVDEAD